MTTVLLHPIGLDRQCWQFIPAERLEDVVAVDLLGHGDRFLPSPEVMLRDFAADALDQVPGEVDLVGVSFGGAVALTACLQWPERVRSLLLASSGLGGHRELLRQRATEVEAVGMAGVLQATLERWFTPELLLEPTHEAVTYVSQRLLANAPESFAASWRALAELDAAAEIDRIGVPVTVLHPESDPTGSALSRAEMASLFPRGRLISIPGPHMVHLERPEAFARAVADHLLWAAA